MSVFKCKMCGGDLDIVKGSTVVECEYCGSRQTVPAADDERKLGLFNRANGLLARCEFDKAAGMYESIVAEFSEEAESYWGLILCSYGIEYVDDPATGKKIPTCHRSRFESLMDDPSFESVMTYSDPTARKVYREEAKRIEELRKNIIEVSSNEEPYDIFICYKETAEDGQRTIDSVLAQDIYEKLTEVGYRVFFSRISLEDKLGQEYEPYIFAALNSAKVMLVFGTDYEYFNAVWVKNEWSRYLKLMEKDKTKRLIPCYKDIDAYDMPKEFIKLQSQDMGKVGADQDLIRAIKKLLQKEPAQQVVVNGPTIESLMNRVNTFLSQGEWVSAKDYCNRVLDIESENSDAYLGLLLAASECDSKTSFENRFTEGCAVPQKEYDRAKQYANAENAAWFSRIEKEKENRKQIKAADLKSVRIKAAAMRRFISAGYAHSVGLKADGSVISTAIREGNTSETKDYGQCNVSGWRCITAVSAGVSHTVGLKADGTVIAVGRNENLECAVEGWNDIVSISAAFRTTYGLRSNGTVIYTDKNNAQMQLSCHGITAISGTSVYCAGLRQNGTVSLNSGINTRGLEEAQKWDGIVDVAASRFFTIGLRYDGTVLAASVVEGPYLKTDYGQCEVSSWKDIVAVAAGGYHTVGLKRDGTVVAVGRNDYGQCSVDKWNDIVAIAAGDKHTIGLKRNGTVVAAGCNSHGECEVGGWKLFNDADHIREETTALLKNEKQRCLNELAEATREFENAKGLLAGAKRKKLQTKIDELKGQIGDIEKLEQKQLIQ